MRMAIGDRRLWVTAVLAGSALLVSCSTTHRSYTARLAAFAPSPPSPPAPPMLVDPPPALAVLAVAHLPAQDPAVALIYRTEQLRAPSDPRRNGQRGWRRNSARLITEFRQQELETWKQAPALVSQQAEPLLLEDLLRLNIEEDSKVSPDLQTLLLATPSDLALKVNDKVLRYVNYFLGRGRNTLRESLRRAGAYRPMVSRILKEEGLPQDLVYLVQAESGFRPKARSPKKATGMWQFVPGRGREYGLSQNRHVDERLDPEKATRAAARHLADLYAQFGNWYLAMAAYNCGPGCVQRAVERTGYADYWELVRRGAIPRETSNYVPVILAMAALAKNAEVFHLDDVVPEDPINYDTVATRFGIGLNLIADATGVTVARIKQLNPALLAEATPEGPYSLRIPKDTARRFEEEIAAVPETRRKSWRRHEVRENETLAQIAARYKVRPEDIALVNSLGRQDPSAGDRLTIPVPYQTQASRMAARSGPGRRPRGASAALYTVRSGDTLGAIAQRHGVTVAQLQQWNRLKGTRLDVGQVLHLRASSPAPSQASASRTRLVRADLN